MRGERRSYIIVVEVLPTMTSLIVANFLGAALYSVLTAAGLQFLGLGDPNSISWGTMLYWSQNQQALQTGMPLWSIAPGLCVALLGVSFALHQLRLRRDQQPGPATGEEAPCQAHRVLEVRGLRVEYATARGPVGRRRRRRPRRRTRASSSAWSASPAAASRRCCSPSPGC